MAGKSYYRRFRNDFCLPVLFLNRLEYNMNLQRYFLFLLLMPFLFSCDEQDNWENRPDTTRGILFHLSEEPYDGETPQTTRSTGEFSRVEHLIVTDEGDPVPNIKSTYLAENPGRRIAYRIVQTAGIRYHRRREQRPGHGAYHLIDTRHLAFFPRKPTTSAGS